MFTLAVRDTSASSVKHPRNVSAMKLFPITPSEWSSYSIRFY